MIYWLCAWWYSPQCCPSLLPEHTAAHVAGNVPSCPASWSPACIAAWGFSFPSARLSFVLGEFHNFLSAQPSSLSRSLWLVALLLSIFDWSAQFGVIWKLGENTLHWLLQVIDICKTEQVLVTSLQAEDNPLTTTFWNQLSKQFFTHYINSAVLLFGNSVITLRNILSQKYI